MSEKLHTSQSAEHHRHIEHDRAHEKESLKHLQEKARNATEKSHDELKEIKKSIESTALSGKEYAVGEHEASPVSHPHGITKTLKRDAYRRTVKKTQAKLSAPERTFSKVVHAPVIEKASEVAAKTVARPSGILVGGFGAFAGTMLVFYISKRTGFAYNYALFVFIFLGCYIFGVVSELFLQLFRSRKKH